MNNTDFDQLLSLVIENEASTEQVELLLETLRDDPALLEEARQQFALHGQIGVALESEFSTEKFISNTTTAISHADGEDFSEAVVKTIHRRQWITRFSAIAAVLLIGIAALYVSFFNDPVSLDQEQTRVASLTRVEGVSWRSGSIRINKGDTIHEGQKISLLAGLVEVDLDGRGSLIIEGPAEVQFNSGMEAVISRGSLVMRATEKGHGYTVRTPNGKVVDLGTEFAINVGENNIVETHVIEGSVEATSNDGKSVTLLQNDALRFDSEGGKSIIADTGRFYTSLPPIHSEAKFIHWPFDEGKDSKAKAEGQLGSETGQNNDLIFYTTKGGKAPQWQPGINGSAIHLDGVEAFGESSYKGILGGKPRTVCFWVKTPSEFSIKQGFGIVSWGNPRRKGETWQISVNPLEADGKIGRLRLGLHGGQIIGSTDLRDDKWHHVAVVLYGGSQPNVGTHAILYIDGQKEEVSRASLREVKTTADRTNHGVWVGRNVTFTEDIPKHDQGNFFRGGLDDLYIFDAALSQSEVKELMEKK